MKLGFIGCGNMAGAMIGGILKNNILPADELIGSALRESTLCLLYTSMPETSEK